jgi:beta-carotene ketolase (CrtO type)
MGSFTNALARDVVARGGAIRTSTKVTELLASGDRISGIVTSSGEEIRSAQVMGAIDPTTLFLKLAPDALVSATLRSELNALGVYRNNFASCRADVALDRRPQLIVGEERSRALLPSSMMFAESLESIRRTSNAVSAGEIAPDIPVWISAPSVIDRSLVPPGSSGEGLYVFVPAVPFRPRGDSSWTQLKQHVLSDTLKTFEDSAPGMSASIIGSAVRSPEDLRSLSNVHLGHLFHADMSVAQMGPWRPTPSLAGYKSPIQGLWHTGAGAHPMGTICAWPGRAAAQAFLKRVAAE